LSLWRSLLEKKKKRNYAGGEKTLRKIIEEKEPLPGTYNSLLYPPPT